MMIMGDKKKAITAILGERHPNVGERWEDGPKTHDALSALGSELCEAVKSDDGPGVVSALRAIFAELDSEPHAEGPHIEE